MEQVADAGRVRAEADGVKTIRGRNGQDICGREDSDVVIVLDVGGHGEIAYRRVRATIVGERILRARQQIVRARLDDRGVRDDTDEDGRGVAVRAHLEDAVAVRRIIDACAVRDAQVVRRVVVQLDEVVARACGAGRA